jgi:hypothetical protein
MKLLLKGTLATLLLTLFSISASAQKKTYECSFLEISMGMRQYSDIPNDVFVRKDTGFLDNMDFGKGQSFAASLGAAFLPDENGFAGNFLINGLLGASSGFGFELGFGYKLGNEKFSFAPMAHFGLTRIFNYTGSYNIDSSLVSASVYDGTSQAIYVGGGVNLHGGSGSSITYTVNYAIFDLKLGAYLGYKISPKYTLFGKVGYNYGFAKSKAEFTASGKGYESFDAFWDAAIAEANGEAGSPPVIISTDINTTGFLQQNGNAIDKVPVNFSGFQFQIGIGINSGK